MKIIRVWLIVFLIPGSVVLHSQAPYYAGSAVAGIEPPASTISLALAGFAAPASGRFTLQWIKKAEVPVAGHIFGIGNNLYIGGIDGLFFSDMAKSNFIWQKSGDDRSIHCITGYAGKLYGIDGSGKLLVSGAGKRIRWKNLGTVDKSVKAVAVLNQKIYAANSEGDIWSCSVSGRDSSRERSTAIRGIVSLTSDESFIYALTNGGDIYRYDPESRYLKWLKIACRNGMTIREEIRKIAICGNRIYGISDRNILYEGQHRSEGNLTARALAIRDDDKTVLLVSVDVTGLTADFTGGIKKEIYEHTGIPPSAVFINCTHTHFAPVTQDWPTWQEQNQKPDSSYLYSTVGGAILDAVNSSLEKLSPADIWFGRGKTDIGYNRSLRDHKELYDSTVDVIRIKYRNSEAENAVFMASCHPVGGNTGKVRYTLSAGFPGVARKLVEERSNASVSMFLQGTAGDINPRDNGEYISGEKLANEVISILGRTMIRIEGPISFYMDTIDVPVVSPDMDEITAFRAANADQPGDLSAERNMKWCDLMQKNLTHGRMPSSVPLYRNTINIGNWKLVGFSRETTTPYAFDVRKLWPEKTVSVAGYTNDVSSYLPTALHFDKKGYEGLDSFYWYSMPGIFRRDVEELVINAIRSTNH